MRTKNAVVRKAVVPLVTLAVLGLAGCEGGSGKGTTSTPPSAGETTKKDPKQNPATPATDDQLAAVILDTKDVPSGYRPGTVSHDEEGDDPNDTVSPSECGVLAGKDSMPSIGHAEREYTTEAGDPASAATSVKVSMSSETPDELKNELVAYLKALDECPAFDLVSPDLAMTVKVSNVRKDAFGKDTAAFDLSFAANGVDVGDSHAAVVIKGTTALSISSFAQVGKGEPADVAPFVKAQVAKLEKLPPAKGTPTPKKPVAPTTSAPKDLPSGDVLTRTLTNSAELPAGYSVKDTTTKNLASPSSPSDPKCAPLLDNSLATGATGFVQRSYVKTSPTSEATIVTLASARPGAVLKQLRAYAGAAQSCGTFTVTSGGDTTTYTVSNVQAGKYGTDSVTYTMTIKDKDGTVYSTATAAFRGPIVVEFITASVQGQPAEPTEWITGQLEKMAQAG